MKHLVCINVDRTCDTVIPSPNFKNRYADIVKEKGLFRGIAIRDMTSDIYLELLKEQMLPQYVSVRITDTKNIPYKFSAYQEAWTDDYPTETVDIDLEKAKKIHINILREIRKIKFKEIGFPIRLNPELEAGLLTAPTKAKLKALRDLTKNLDLSKVTTINELITIIPIELIK